MTHEEFVTLVERLEVQAQQHPVLYQCRVIMLALLGYGYLAAVVLLLLLLILITVVIFSKVAVLAFKLIIFILPIIWLILKSLWIQFPKPEGIEITAKEAPALFEMIHGLQKKLKSRRFHHVLITHEFNAAVVQRPQLGPLGWYSNYLLIGLPLLKALDQSQFEAVLAHEFGHLSAGHAAVSNHIYRLRLGWAKLLDRLNEDEHISTILFKPFFNWFSPYFNAYSFPLARANEYEADAAAARHCSPQIAAQALTNVEVIAAYLSDKFWPGIYKQIKVVERPAFSPYQIMGEHFVAADVKEQAHTWIDLALKNQPNFDNTHPVFAERLKALKQAPQFSVPDVEAAADQLLGPARNRITDLYDQEWLANITPHWQERYQYLQEGAVKLAELAAKEKGGDTLSADEQYQCAMLIDELEEDKDQSLSRLQVLCQQAPDHQLATYQLGARLLAENDEAGVAMLEKCIDYEPDIAMPALERLYHYHDRQQRKGDAQRYAQIYAAKSEQIRAVQSEQTTVRMTDQFLCPEQPADVIRNLKEALRNIQGIHRAYLVQRKLKLQPDVNAYALGFSITPWWRWHRSKLAQEIQSKIVHIAALPEGAMVFCTDGDNRQFAKKFKRIRGARLL